MTRTVVALGGNTLLRRGERSYVAQKAHVEEAADVLARLRARGRELVLTHGNGPQVGNLLLQQEQADVEPMPLDVLVAETQAQIGYVLQQALDNRIERGRAVSVVTQVLVDGDDPAFENPTKPVGPFYTEAEAASKPFETKQVRTGADEKAYRRVVPSPAPTAVVEADRVRDLVASGATVIAAGGGGVPVVDAGDGLRGVEAVVDKDHTSQVLATALDASVLVVLTNVEYAYEHFQTDDQRAIREATPADLREYLDAGEFAPGSMRPKIEACRRFVEDSGGRAVITTPEHLREGLAGTAGTQIRPVADEK